MKAAKRKASRRGAKRARTPEELEIKSTFVATYLRQAPLVERKKKLRKLIERSECSEILHAQHIERNGKLLFVNDGVQEDPARCR
jgi:hypothetical protein